MTGSVPLGVTAGIAVGSLLGAACRPLVRILSISGRRVMGEQRGLIVEDDFEEVVDVVADVTPRGRIVHGVQTRPDKVADSVRSLLTGTRRR